MKKFSRSVGSLLNHFEKLPRWPTWVSLSCTYLSLEILCKTYFKSSHLQGATVSTLRSDVTEEQTFSSNISRGDRWLNFSFAQHVVPKLTKISRCSTTPSSSCCWTNFQVNKWQKCQSMFKNSMLCDLWVCQNSRVAKGDPCRAQIEANETFEVSSIKEEIWDRVTKQFSNWFPTYNPKSS